MKHYTIIAILETGEVLRQEVESSDPATPYKRLLAIFNRGEVGKHHKYPAQKPAVCEYIAGTTETTDKVVFDLTRPSEIDRLLHLAGVTAKP